jgi:hypothetical protein
MVTNTWEAVWARVRAGKHVIITGAARLPPAPSDLLVISVSCEAFGASNSVLQVVLRKLEQLLGEALLPSESRRESFEVGLRHRFLGDMPGQPMDALFVEASNRLAERTGGRAVLAFESIDAADEATVATLAQIVKRPAWLRLPLILTVHGQPQGLVAELIYLLCHDDGHAALTEINDETTHEVQAPFEWTTLPPDVLRVLRAGSVLGTAFEADLIARLLDEPVGMVLDKLQWAADAGAPLADRGAGRFTLPAASITALQSRMLPSLLTFWHTRLSDILREGRSVAEAAEFGPRAEAVSGREPPLPNYAELFQPAQPSTSPVPPTVIAQEDVPPVPVPDAQQPFSPRQRPDRATPATQPSTDQSRAAAHLRAAGQVEAAIEQYLAAVREVAVRGDAQRAYGLAEQALQLFDELPPSNRRALLRVQLLIEKGRLQWHGALLGASFTLQEALASLETARLSLPDDAVPEVVAQLATVTAGICYDLGDLDALQRGLEVLTESSRRLLDMGESLLATCLLNDQAAVYVRLGDPVRASHLLSKSHELFDGLLRRNPHDLMALEELAETNHLLAACLCMCTFAPDASPRRMLVVSNMRVGRNVSINASGHVSNWRVSGKRWDVWKCSVGNCRWRRSALPQHSRCNGRWVM